MADLSAKKSDALSELVQLIPQAVAMAARCKELVDYVTDNAFLAGGCEAVVDGDCIGANSHLTAASFNAAIAAIGTVTLSAANKTTLRKATRRTALSHPP